MYHIRKISLTHIGNICLLKPLPYCFAQSVFGSPSCYPLEIDRYIGPGWYLGFADISVSASVGVDKTLLYTSRMQTTCARKHNEPSQHSYLAADAFS